MNNHDGLMDLSDADVIKVLALAATNDRFREKMEKDPVKTLEEHGIEFDADNVPADVTLPNKETLIDELAPSITEIRAGKLKKRIFCQKLPTD